MVRSTIKYVMGILWYRKWMRKYYSWTHKQMGSLEMLPVVNRLKWWQILRKRKLTIHIHLAFLSLTNLIRIYSYH